jgi:hypothetical protein
VRKTETPRYHNKSPEERSEEGKENKAKLAWMSFMKVSPGLGSRCYRGMFLAERRGDRRGMHLELGLVSRRA